MRLPDPPSQIHATCVALGGRGLLILGASGSGKSGLALQLMAYGAELVCDDRCDLRVIGQKVQASRPDQLPQAIEARGLGLLPAACAGPAQLIAAVDMDHATEARMPEPGTCQIGTVRLPLLVKFSAPHFPAALYHYLKAQN
ncbi:Hpr(Ser) kinase/phosphatase [Litoreibacter ponti]|uniref:Hpr(Ser) kinase/phosphatase n=1 Tax=Litoreibacter ponti TaxID=1510457 RepID=A0A2T6BMI0_9RHOB|nr:serine kinase [Litoreibacter ponti]PTX57283.1 Hpr(Ser) kinase/phosphatase [Litoreibacter ponti]